MGTLLSVEALKLSAAETEILQAIQDYRSAVAEAQSAAEDLIGKWEGEAQAAFAAEQQKAYGWHMNITDIVERFARTLKDAARKYLEGESRVTGIINGGGGGSW